MHSFSYRTLAKYVRVYKNGALYGSIRYSHGTAKWYFAGLVGGPGQYFADHWRDTAKQLEEATNG